VPNYAIARHAKLKGGSVSASSYHNLRTRETPNADERRRDENRILYGDDRPLRDKVDERISESDARTRSDNVECVEYMLTATREHFLDERGEIDAGKLEKWVSLNMEFLREECGPDLIGAVLHMDETTPHIAAYRVPLKDGKLNCKHFYGTRELNRRFQTRYAEKMKALGLERGVEKSRARHQDIRRFYGSINAPVKLQIRTREITNPPRVFVTQSQQNEYKEAVVKEVMGQITPQVQALRDKALTAEDEKRRRVAAEKRAAERIAAAERARETAEIRRQVEGKRVEELSRENAELRQRGERLSRALSAESQRAERSDARVRDVPLTEVMSRLGCEGHLQPDGSVVYLSDAGEKALSVKDGKAYDCDGTPAAGSAVRLLLHVCNDHLGQNASREDALRWMADNFGEKQAVAAFLVEQEQILTDYLEGRERDRGERDHKHDRPLAAQGQERSDEQTQAETTRHGTQAEELVLLH
jgi:hypothetical protein